MDSNSVLFDISSDEEPAIEEPKEFDDDCNWLTELLRNFDKENDDSDDVVIVGEYKPPKPKSKSKSLNEVADIKFFLDDDDDCVVLSGDPDKPAAAVDDVCRNEADSSDEGDDVLVVGEKGQDQGWILSSKVKERKGIKIHELWRSLLKPVTRGASKLIIWGYLTVT